MHTHKDLILPLSYRDRSHSQIQFIVHDDQLGSGLSKGCAIEPLQHDSDVAVSGWSWGGGSVPLVVLGNWPSNSSGAFHQRCQCHKTLDKRLSQHWLPHGSLGSRQCLQSSDGAVVELHGANQFAFIWPSNLLSRLLTIHWSTPRGRGLWPHVVRTVYLSIWLINSSEYAMVWCGKLEVLGRGPHTCWAFSW